MGINIGALIAPLVVGTLGQEYNYHLGFSVAAVGMFFGYYNIISKDVNLLLGLVKPQLIQCLKKSKEIC